MSILQARDLIETLNRCDPDAEVQLWRFRDGTFHLAAKDFRDTTHVRQVWMREDLATEGT